MKSKIFFAAAAPLVAAAFLVSAHAEIFQRELKPAEIISADELRALQAQGAAFTLFDARAKHSFEEAHIEGALLPLRLSYYNDMALFNAGILPTRPDFEKALAEAMAERPRDALIVTYCDRDCNASAYFLLGLEKLGFTNVKAMKEGFQSWQEKGYPVAKS